MLLALAAILCTKWDGGAFAQGTEPAVATVPESAIEEARRALERGDAAQARGEDAGVRTEAARVIELFAELSVEELTAQVASFLNRAARLAYAAKGSHEARTAWSRALQFCERTYPADDAHTAATRLNLANTLADLGDHAGARALEEAAVASFERTLPADHTNLALARTNLAKTSRQLGDFARARELLESVVASYERTLPVDHRNLLAVRLDLAVAVQELGEPRRAHEILEAVLAVYERTVPPDHIDLVRPRQLLGLCKKDLGDLDGARVLQESLVASCARTLPPDALVLLGAQHNLANTLHSLGDLGEARAIREAVLAAYARTLPEGHPELLSAKQSLAISLKVMGELQSARELEESVLEVYERTLPASHTALLHAQHNLASILEALGDLSGARALEETVLEACEANLPEGHPFLLAARVNLAGTLAKFGDRDGARALFEAVLESYERTLPAEHPNVLGVRQNLATLLEKMGDPVGARAQIEAVLAVYERTLPAEHPEFLRARQILAMVSRRIGDLQAARANLETVLAAFERTMPEDDPNRLRAQLNLATVLRESGERERALELQEIVLGIRERLLPADHPDVLLAQEHLAKTVFEMGDADRARALALDLAHRMLGRLRGVCALSPREAREAVVAEQPRLALVRCLTVEPASRDVRLARFELAETMRHVSSGSVRVGETQDAERALLQTRIAELRERLGNLVAGGPRGRTAEEFDAEVSALAMERDALERRLPEGSLRFAVIRPDELARALPESSAVVGFLRCTVGALEADSGRIGTAREVFAAHVLSPDGMLAEVELGPVHEVEGLVHAWRAALERPADRGITASEPDVDRERAAGEALRERVLDPVLELSGAGTTTLFVCLDDLLFLVPLDALPLGEERVGDRYRIVQQTSFGRLLAPRRTSVAEPGLLAVGGVDFGAEVGGDPHLWDFPSPPLGSTARSTFAPLLQTRVEVEAAALLFERAFHGEVELLTGALASKTAFRELAPGKRFVHAATHGWFAQGDVPSHLDLGTQDVLRDSLDSRDATKGFAPWTLCGLALAGANRGGDSRGRVAGILTAEELAGVDLSACELAVLSACGTNVGPLRAGAGIQSLQTALHAAGARTAITSLWKVDDAATRRLMELFYTYSWLEGIPKAEALWRAKRDLRREGHSPVDWAAWVLSGDPS